MLPGVTGFRLKAGLQLATLVTAAAGVLRADPPCELPPLPSPAHGLPPIACWAVPSNNSHYFGYYVGGGCALPYHAEPRYRHEGTWGWDYDGWVIHRLVSLGWWHGRCYQGGTGAYRIDGPHYVPVPEQEHER
jgi:hypothetical protein